MKMNTMKEALHVRNVLYIVDTYLLALKVNNHLMISAVNKHAIYGPLDKHTLSV
jgi:hypothetical protein